MVRWMSTMILLLCAGPLKIKCSPGCSLRGIAMHQRKMALTVSYMLVFLSCSCYFSPCLFDLIWNKSPSGCRKFWFRCSGNGTGLGLWKRWPRKSYKNSILLHSASRQSQVWSGHLCTAPTYLLGGQILNWMIIQVGFISPSNFLPPK